MHEKIGSHCKCEPGGALGYDGIVYNSQRFSQGTNIVLFKNFNLLKNGAKIH